MKPIASLTVSLLALAFSASVLAKLPPPSDEAKAKAAETKAKTAWTGKVGAYKVCLLENHIADQYRARVGAAASAPVSTPPCANPGQFAYAPPTASPPLEAAGAHSPAQTAVAPPSSKETQAEQKVAAPK